MIVGKGNLQETGWKDCATCEEFDRGTFVCGIFGYGTLADKVYLSCRKYTRR